MKIVGFVHRDGSDHMEITFKLEEKEFGHIMEFMATYFRLGEKIE